MTQSPSVTTGPARWSALMRICSARWWRAMDLVWLVVISSFVLLLSSCASQAPLLPREAAETPEGLSVIWSFDEARSIGYPLAGDAASMVYIYTVVRESELVAIDFDTGAVAWRRALPAILRGIQSIATWNQFVLSATTTELSAYGREWGNLVWSTLLGTGHVPVVLQVDGDVARVYYGERLFEVDPTSGVILKDMPLGDILWIQGAYVIHVTPDRRGMWATNAFSEELLWNTNEVPFLRKEWSAPVASDPENLVVGLSDRSICSLHILSGQYSWCRSEVYLSNPSVDVDGRIAYALTTGFVLQALDAVNGDLLQAIQFSPSTLPASLENQVFAYSVATTRSGVSVLFGDSWQLFGVTGADRSP